MTTDTAKKLEALMEEISAAETEHGEALDILRKAEQRLNKANHALHHALNLALMVEAANR